MTSGATMLAGSTQSPPHSRSSITSDETWRSAPGTS